MAGLASALAYLDTLALLGVIGFIIYLMVAAWKSDLWAPSLNGDGGLTSVIIMGAELYLLWQFWKSVYGDCPMTLPKISAEYGLMTPEGNDCPHGPLTQLAYSKAKGVAAGLGYAGAHKLNRERMEVYAAAARAIESQVNMSPAAVPAAVPTVAAASEVSSNSSASSVSVDYAQAVRAYTHSI